MINLLGLKDDYYTPAGTLFGGELEGPRVEEVENIPAHGARDSDREG